MSKNRILAVVPLLALAACPPLGSTSQPLVSGSDAEKDLRSEIGWLSMGCTATVVDPAIVLTAAYCLGYQNSVPADAFFAYTPRGGAKEVRVGVVRGYSLGAEGGEMDLAVVRLAREVVDRYQYQLRPARIEGGPPEEGDRVTLFGYGCIDRNTGWGGGTKRYVEFEWGSSTSLCDGDLGGPVVYGEPQGQGSIWGVSSGYELPNGSDHFALASHAIPLVNAVRRIGGTTYNDVPAANFAGWAKEPGARLVSGDFNGDGVDDLALTGAGGWGTIPVALKSRSGIGFRIENWAVADFPGWAAYPGVQVLSGDFDEDGWGDIALVGGPHWTTIAVAYSKPPGIFIVRNVQLPEFADLADRWGSCPISTRCLPVTAVSGDFDGDGASDIALVGGDGTTIPIAFSRGFDRFEMKKISAPEFTAFARWPGARPVAGRFLTPNKTVAWSVDRLISSIALIGGIGWGTIPLVVLSPTENRFYELNPVVADFPLWARSPGVKVAAGDFDGDGSDDLVLAGSPGWRTLAFAFSDGHGGFEPGNLPIDQVPGWAADPGVQMVTGDFTSDRWQDVAFAGAWGRRTVPIVWMRGR